MRLVFPEPNERKPLEQLLHEAKEMTSIILPEDNGFKVRVNNEPFDHIYLHKGDSYRRLRAEDLMVFQPLFELLYDKIFHDGIPEYQRPLLAELMATNEHVDYSQAASIKLPGHKLSVLPIDRAELGAWGSFDRKSVEEAAKQMAYTSPEEYLKSILPVFTYDKDGNPILQARLRANRPCAPGANQTTVSNLQPQIFQSIHYGYPGNVHALKDILFGMTKSGVVSRQELEYLLNNPKALETKGIGSLVNGAAIILSLDSEENNTKYANVLDKPFAIESYSRDISPLSIAGIKAISLVNRFSSLVRNLDDGLQSYLSRLDIEIPKNTAQLNGKPVLAEGVCIVTYTTGFETDYSQMTAGRIAAMYKSVQLAIKRVMQQSGYEKASYMIGENIGKSAGATLVEKHLQAYISKNISIRPNHTRIEPTKDNVLFENDSVYVIAHPESHGQVLFQFKDNKDFLERTGRELLDYSEARLYNFHKLNKLGITSDRNVYLVGNDFTVRPVPENEKSARLGFIERGSGIRIVSTDNFSPLELAANTPGDQKQFIEMYKKAA